MIFKIQRSFNNNDVLAYDKSRSYMGVFALDIALRQLFGDEYKIYVLEKVDENGKLHIRKKVKERDW